MEEDFCFLNSLKTWLVPPRYQKETKNKKQKIPIEFQISWTCSLLWQIKKALYRTLKIPLEHQAMNCNMSTKEIFLLEGITKMKTRSKISGLQSMKGQAANTKPQISSTKKSLKLKKKQPNKKRIILISTNVPEWEMQQKKRYFGLFFSVSL